MTFQTPTFADFTTARPSSRPLWIAAVLVAVGLHAAGVAFAIVTLRSDDSDDDLGAPAIEIGLEMTAPHEEATDLPPGPVSEASAASPPVPEQKAELKQSELPKDTPTETEDPDRLVSPEATKPPTEKDPEIKAVETAPSAESAASEATAPPANEVVQEAPKSVAPVQGIGQSAQRIRTTWQKELVTYLDKHKRYPAGHMPRGVAVTVSFTLDRMGHVLAAHVAKSSGDPAFDEAAVAMVRRSDPVPPPPPLVADEGLTFSVPVVFRTKGRS